MHEYQYKYGDRPLEGYTIQRAAGRGGFGEVYYAVSDGGKEVALKTIQNYEQIELRGINHCMNLKSPYLVTVFDVKRNAKNKPFVIMEYVSGPSLADIIKESPAGLGQQKTAFFLREIAKGLSYLHECGIVHRDLKPSNIFYENGQVKIGDYGLSKAINSSQHTQQTITVGTVHYMAPEIGAGRYGKSIDIYALGIVLYEMLTGQVPFFGASPGEVLMKHMSGNVELEGIDEPFASVVRKAMAKDPADRYQTVQAMVEDVFGAEHVRNSMSQFSPASLSMVAERIAKKVKPQPGERPKFVGAEAQRKEAQQPETFSRMSGRAVGKAVFGPDKAVKDQIGNTYTDTVTPKQRHMLSIIAAVAVAIGATAMTGPPDIISNIPRMIIFILMVMVGSKIVLTARWKWFPNLENETGVLRRLAVGGTAGASIALMMHFTKSSGRGLSPMIFLSLVGVMCIVDWWKLTSPNRNERISLKTAIFMAIVGFVLASSLPDKFAPVIACILAGVCIVVQISSPINLSASSVAAVNQKQRPGAANKRQGRKQAVAAGFPSNVSSHNRLVAMILCGGWFMGISGLQRFYVGKIGTGLLWLFTFGLFGIGQLIDVIMIAAGSFTDSNGRSVTLWDQDDVKKYSQVPPAAAVQANNASDEHVPENNSQPPSSTFSQNVGSSTQSFVINNPTPFNPVGAVCSFVGGFLLLFAILIGLAIALHLPALIAADVFESGLSQQLDRVFGYQGWPGLLERIGVSVVLVLMVIGAIFTVIGRRGGGGFHIIRAIIGYSGIFGSFAMIADSMPKYSQQVIDMLKSDQLGPAIEQLLDTTNVFNAVWGAIFFTISVIILAWPAKREKKQLVLNGYERGEI